MVPKSSNILVYSVVDENDKLVGSADYDTIHTKGLLHRLVCIFVLDKKGNLFLQKRARSKPHGGLYSDSVAGHVLYQEGYDEAAKRKLKQEVGLEDESLKVTKIRYRSGDKIWINNVFATIYQCQTERSPIINPEEIEEGDFIEVSEIKQHLRQKPETFVPGFKSTFEAYLKNRK